jgi:hypothetical protein
MKGKIENRDRSIVDIQAGSGIDKLFLEAERMGIDTRSAEEKNLDKDKQMNFNFFDLPSAIVPSEMPTVIQTQTIPYCDAVTEKEDVRESSISIVEFPTFLSVLDVAKLFRRKRYNSFHFCCCIYKALYIYSFISIRNSIVY